MEFVEVLFFRDFRCYCQNLLWYYFSNFWVQPLRRGKMECDATFQVVVQVVPSPMTGCFHAVYISAVDTLKRQGKNRRTGA